MKRKFETVDLTSETNVDEFLLPIHPFFQLLSNPVHLQFLLENSNYLHDDYENLQQVCQSKMKAIRSEKYIRTLKDKIISHPQIISKIIKDPQQRQNEELKTEIASFLQDLQFTKIERNEILGIDVAYPVEVYLIEFMYHQLHIQLHFHISYGHGDDEEGGNGKETHYMIKMNNKRMKSELSDKIIELLECKQMKIHHFLSMIERLYDVFRCPVKSEWTTAYF